MQTIVSWKRAFPVQPTANMKHTFPVQHTANPKKATEYWSCSYGKLPSVVKALHTLFNLTF